MKASVTTILPQLPTGSYVLRVTKTSGAHTIPLSATERQRIAMLMAQERAEKRPRGFEPGVYIVDIDDAATMAAGVTTAEIQRITAEILGASE